ncbi:MAG TPA: penicillin-binding protein 2 [Rickettsiales bacterium]|nr:penicillin-binding protein 2 [Rickettsiales bacterium]
MKEYFKKFINVEESESVFLKDRLKFILCLLFTIFCVLIIKLFYVSIFLKQKNIQLNDLINNNTMRSSIVDRNGVIIASDIDLVNFYLNRDLLTNPKKTSEIIKQIIPEINEQKLYEKLISSKNKAKFILIKKNITPKQQIAIKESGILGFEFNSTKGRIYPHKNLFSHIVGYVDVDRNGIAGLEKQYNEYLKSSNGTPLQLTLDIRLQSMLRQQLIKGMNKYHAKSIIGIISEVKTGNILAIVNLPDFDPNQSSQATKEELYDKATYSLYEMGSIFKIFTVALALDEGITTPNKKYDVSQIISYGKYEIKQDRYSKRFETPEDILVYSSNVGAGLIGLEIGTDRLKAFLEKIGMFDRVPTNFPSLAKPLLPKVWREINTITASYGHGLSVTPLHIVMAVGGIVNNGLIETPKFVQNESSIETKIISEKTSKIMNLYLRSVVKRGSGWRANSLGYAVGGKTGSARLLDREGEYQQGNIMANFVGVFPMNDPHFLIYIMVESPKNSEFTKETISGGNIAAPIFARIIESIAPVLNVIPYVERIE